MRRHGEGRGDVTFGLDVPAERLAELWLRRTARETPLSLLTEDTGWRHMGPAPGGRAVELPGFDHGGPRVSLDPVDGTRNLMTDLRSAWTVVGCCGPGSGEPRMQDVSLGIVAEIPDSRAAVRRTFRAVRGGGCTLETRWLADPGRRAVRELHVDEDDRVDHGYFPFFRYAPDMRPPIARVEALFFERLERHESADTRHCFDDQYICSAGQLALLMLGTYRMVADLRPLVARRLGRPTVPSKPYDLAGAVLCAREAGCVVEAPEGGALDVPLDCETPVAFVAFANERTADRLRPHLHAALDEAGPLEGA